MAPIAQDSTCGALPAIKHAVPSWESMVQLMPASDGKGSLTATPVAVPGPPLPTMIEKPTSVPPLTGVASAVLVIARAGGSTTIVALDSTVGALVAEALAVLGSDPAV